ncbi:MAG: hypothetical protein J7493_05540 [Porphyrobacter sp.]|nr:hypothetical protein [Porphyrobacter sp.]
MRAFFNSNCPARVAAACFLLAGCSGNDREAQPRVLTAELAAEIEGICGLPVGALKGQASISDGDMPKIACVIKEGQKRNVAIGLISNPADLE